MPVESSRPVSSATDRWSWPDRIAAILIATEPETRSLDLALADELLASGSWRAGGGRRGGPRSRATQIVGALDRALAPAVSVLPCQLLAWRLATTSGREPGAFHRATKVTTDE